MGRAPHSVRMRAGGYVTVVEPEQLDLLRLRAHLKTREHAEATTLWRGPVLANVPSESLHRDLVPALVEDRLAALEKRIDDDLGDAQADDVRELPASLN